MLEIYLDLVILLNFSVDFLLLMGTNRLSGFPLSPGRCAWAAVLGAVYSGACLLPGFSFLGALLWRMVSLAECRCWPLGGIGAPGSGAASLCC